MALSPKDKQTLIFELWNKFMNQLHCEIEDEDIYSNITEFLVEEMSVYRQEKLGLQVAVKNFLDYFICELCMDVLLDPITLLCGHTYCKSCLKKKDLSHLCKKCSPGENPMKMQRFVFSKDNRIDLIQCDVTISSTIQKCFPNRLKGKQLRIEGNAYFAKGNYHLSERNYLQSLQENPESYLSYANLSHLRTVEGCFNEALEFASKCILLAPLWSKGYYRQGVAYKGLLKYCEASEAFLKYLTLEPDSTNVRSLLCESLKEIIRFSSNNGCSVDNPLGSILVNQNTNSFSNNINTQHVVHDVVMHLLVAGIEFCIFCHSAIPSDKETLLKDRLEILNVELTCPLCCRLLFNPCTTRCGHSFCACCLERSLDYASLCPICRRPVQELIVVRPKPISYFIDSLVKRYFPDECNERQSMLLENEISIYDEDEVTIPIFVCSLTLPSMETPLHIFEPKYKLLIRRCLETQSKMFGMCAVDEMECFVSYGTMLEIRNSKLLNDGRLLIETCGGRRFQVLERGKKDGYHTARVSWIKDEKKLIDEDQYVQELCRHSYTVCKSWLENELPRILYCRLQIEFGKLPGYNREEMEDEFGPKWVWWMIRLLTQGHPDDALKALKSTSHKERLELIETKLHNIRELFSQNNSS